MSYECPFAGLRVVDLSQGVAGPYCAMLAAQYGADVIKIEPPEGDWIRGIGRRIGDHSPIALAVNRGKRSIVVDLKTPDGPPLVRRLAAGADVFIESFRPGVSKRLGLGHEALRAENPKLLYLSVSGFGQSGPYAGRQLTDTVAQAFTGLMAVNVGNDGVPHRHGLILVDLVTALHAYQTMATALFARRETGTGRYIDVNLMQSAAAFQAVKIAIHALEGTRPEAPNPPAGTYPVKDGQIVITLVKEDQFRRLVEVLGLPHLADDPRYNSFASRTENMETLRPQLERAFLGATAADWQARFEAADVLSQPINDYDAWLADPHIREVGAAPLLEQAGVGRIPVPQIPGVAPVAEGDPRVQTPGLGSDGRGILEELGLSGEEIVRLARAGAVRLPGERQGADAA